MNRTTTAVRSGRECVAKPAHFRPRTFAHALSPMSGDRKTLLRRGAPRCSMWSSRSRNAGQGDPHRHSTTPITIPGDVASIPLSTGPPSLDVSLRTEGPGFATDVSWIDAAHIMQIHIVQIPQAACACRTTRAFRLGPGPSCVWTFPRTSRDHPRKRRSAG